MDADDYDRHHGRKICFDTWIDAWEATVDIYEAERDVLAVYWCRYCEYRHIGHPTQLKRRNLKGRLEKARRKRVARRAAR